MGWLEGLITTTEADLEVHEGDGLCCPRLDLGAPSRLASAQQVDIHMVLPQTITLLASSFDVLSSFLFRFTGQCFP